MDIDELKKRFGKRNLCTATLDLLGYSLENETINLWKDPRCYIELRWDSKQNHYYNQDGKFGQRVDVITINDLIDLYDKLGAVDDLLNRNWCNLK